jgi:VanZ family protein
MPRATADRGVAGPLVGLLRAWGRALQRLPRARAWIPVVLWMGLISFLSSRPGRSGAPSALWAFLMNLAHAPLYGLLALWMALLLPRENGWPRIDSRTSTFVIAALMAFGVTDELHQHFVVRRDLSLLDLGTDLTAAACSLWVAASVGRSDSTEQGTVGRLLLAAGLCLAAAAAATSVPRFFPGVGWM